MFSIQKEIEEEEKKLNEFEDNVKKSKDIIEEEEKKLKEFEDNVMKSKNIIEKLRNEMPEV